MGGKMAEAIGGKEVFDTVPIWGGASVGGGECRGRQVLGAASVRGGECWGL